MFLESQGGTPDNVIRQGEIFLPLKLGIADVGEQIFFQVESNVTLPGIVNQVIVESEDQFTWNGKLTDRSGKSLYLCLIYYYADEC